jgi:hypothetical protein
MAKLVVSVDELGLGRRPTWITIPKFKLKVTATVSLMMFIFGEWQFPQHIIQSVEETISHKLVEIVCKTYSTCMVSTTQFLYYTLASV